MPWELNKNTGKKKFKSDAGETARELGGIVKDVARGYKNMAKSALSNALKKKLE